MLAGALRLAYDCCVLVKGKYLIGERLGGGGMAEVFAATTVGHQGFSRPVALKRVLPGYSANPDFARMFVAEAQLSASLTHPNIVATLDFDRADDGSLFIVMELVSGVDLDTLAKSGTLPFSVISYVIAEVLRGLGFAHNIRLDASNRGLVHRDVSPHNILLSWEGAVKVSDFGLAKARAAGNASASELLKGKPAYMSPEQANSKALDGRSDLFSVGIIMWELLVGRRLFSADDTRATFAALFFGKIPRPQSLRPDVPKDLERVVMKLLERDPEDRYETAEAALVELLGCAAAVAARDSLISILHEQFRAIGPSQGYRFAASDSIAKNAETNSPTVANVRRSRRRMGWLAAALGAAATTTAVALYHSGSLQTSSTATGGLAQSAIASGAGTKPLEQLAPGCVQLISIYEQLSHCTSQSPEWRRAFANATVMLEQRLHTIGVDPILENEGCLMSSKWVEPKLSGCSDGWRPDSAATPISEPESAVVDTSKPMELVVPACAKFVAKLTELAACSQASEVFHQMYVSQLNGMNQSLSFLKLWGTTESSRATLDHNCKGMMDDLERQHPTGC